MEEEKEGEKACDGEMIERQRKKRKKNPLIIHAECTMKRSTGGHLICKTEHKFIKRRFFAQYCT